jgi:hypothetical protein
MVGSDTELSFLLLPLRYPGGVRDETDKRPRRAGAAANIGPIVTREKYSESGEN